MSLRHQDRFHPEVDEFLCINAWPRNVIGVEPGEYGHKPQ
jgi:hypothetical protein